MLRASRFSARAEFPEDPSFDAKFFVFGDDETALRGFFDAGRRARVAAIGQAQVAGHGDAFHFGNQFIRTSGGRERRILEEKLQDLLRDSRTLFEVLKA